MGWLLFPPHGKHRAVATPTPLPCWPFRSPRPREGLSSAPGVQWLRSDQIDTARTVVRLVRDMPDGTKAAPPDDVRFAAVRQNECLTDMLRVVEGRPSPGVSS